MSQFCLPISIAKHVVCLGKHKTCWCCVLAILQPKEHKIMREREGRKNKLKNNKNKRWSMNVSLFQEMPVESHLIKQKSWLTDHKSLISYSPGSQPVTVSLPLHLCFLHTSNQLQYIHIFMQILWNITHAWIKHQSLLTWGNKLPSAIGINLPKINVCANQCFKIY